MSKRCNVEPMAFERKSGGGNRHTATQPAEERTLSQKVKQGHKSILIIGEFSSSLSGTGEITKHDLNNVIIQLTCVNQPLRNTHNDETLTKTDDVLGHTQKKGLKLK